MAAASSDGTLFSGVEDFPYPVTIAREDFQNDLDANDFEPDAFLYDNHRFTLIQPLILDLTTLSRSLNQELLDLVNNDYNDFIRLGKSIDGSLELINNILLSVNTFGSDLEQSHVNFTDSLALVRASLGYKKRMEALKTKIKLSLLLNDSIGNFEVLLNYEISESAPSFHRLVVDKLRNLTSLFLSFTNLYSLLVRDKSTETIHFVSNMKTKILSLKFEFKAYMDEVLERHSRAENGRNSDVLLELVNSYKVTGHEADFFALVKQR